MRAALSCALLSLVSAQVQVDPSGLTGSTLYAPHGGHCYRIIVGTNAFQDENPVTSCDAAGFSAENSLVRHCLDTFPRT